MERLPPYTTCRIGELSMAPHCAEHEQRGDRLTSAEGCIKNLKYNWDMGRQHMAKQVEVITTDLKGKLTASVYYKSMGVLIAVMFAVLGVQWSLLFNMDNTVDRIATDMAVVMSKLENLEK